MNRFFVLSSAALLSIGAAAPASAQSANHILRGVGVGAGAGVLAGAIIPGLGVGEGALIGAASGGLYNTLINKDKRRYYRSSRAYSPRYGSRSRSSAPRYRSYRPN
jgi:hypothetical protein